MELWVGARHVAENFQTFGSRDAPEFEQQDLLGFRSALREVATFRLSFRYSRPPFLISSDNINSFKFVQHPCS
jgi:hypothetical protein